MTEENGITNESPEKNNVLDMDGFRKKKMPTKTELLNKTVSQDQENNDKFKTIQIILNNFNKRMKEMEDRFTNDTMQSIVLILAIKEAMTKELKIDDDKWNSLIKDVTKRLSDEREKDYDDQNGLVTVDRAAIIGDCVVASYEGTIDGQPFEGGKSAGVAILIGSKFFLEDFENSLIGKSRGDIYNTTVKFPSEYQAKDLAGKEAIFQINVLSVKEKKTAEKPNDPTAA